MAEDLKLTPEERSRRPAPQFNPFRSWVTEELNRRKLEMPVSPVSPFVRLTSCQMDYAKSNTDKNRGQSANYAFFTLGLHGFEASDLNIFDVSYTQRDIVGYATDLNGQMVNGRFPKRLISSNELTEGAIPPAIAENLDPEVLRDSQVKSHEFKQTQDVLLAHGAHPIPGITDVRVIRRNLGAPLTIQVSWTCYNRAQLEFLRNHFLIAGRYVVVEWGNQFSTNKIEKKLDFGNVEKAVDDLTTALLKGRTYVIDNWVRPNSGNYDFIVGMVGNFDLEVDMKTNIYTCTTTIYTMGENMWGMDLHKTVVKKENDTVQNQVSSFADFYKYGGEFDKFLALVTAGAGSESLIVKNFEDWSRHNANNAATSKEIKNTTTNPQDYCYVSWKFFAHNVINRMFQMLKESNPHVKSEISQYLKFYTEEDSDDPELCPWVSDNIYLRSTDPATMLIIKQSMSKVPPTFTGAGYFDSFPGSEGWRGRLSRGVWLNAEMIREVFTSNNTFSEAIRDLIKRINNATGNFWNLMLFYDEEQNLYRIIDSGCLNAKAEVLPSFYKFNIGGIGECLDIGFNSAFPPELVTQMALYAHMKSSTAPEQERLTQEYPTLNTTSTFMYSLNWTNLVDVVEMAMAERMKANVSTNSEAANVPLTSPIADKTNQTARNISRVTDSSTSGTGGALAVSPSGAPVGKTVSTVGPTTPPKNIKVIIAKNAKSIGYRNNNPGNLEFANQEGAVPSEPDGRWAKFKTPEDGFAALCKQMEIYKNRQLTLREMVYKYAPPSENNSEGYLRDVSTSLKTSPDTPLVHIDTVSLAKVIARRETSTVVAGLGPITPVQETKFTLTANDDFKVPSEPVGLTDEQQKDLDAKTEEVRNKFGNNIVGLVELLPSVMRNRITRDGFLNYPKKQNSFVCPFPTTTSVSIKIQGISGLSVSDGFYVDRLPFVFEKYGCFQITQINEHVTPQGWTTEIQGYFRLLFLNGEGLAHSAKTSALLHTPLPAQQMLPTAPTPQTTKV